jgi:SAM-dependent methyltransferase
LDWGTGNGHASIFLSRAGFSATGYSLDPFFFKDLLGGLPYEFVAAEASEPTRLPFRSFSFDAVLSVGVLEHVRETGGDELASLREFHRILRPGGVMICVHFPNAASWIDGLARLTGRKFHTYRYTSKQVRTQ